MKKIELTQNALKIAEKRYFMGGENWDKCVDRVAGVISACEDHSVREKVKNDFYDIIYNQYFLPAGRILRNSGRPRGSLFNCYHLPIGDNIEEIGQLIKDSLILWSEGGGVGINFSPLRPRGDAILGKGGLSSGLVSFIEAANAVSHTIESGGSRRAAAIAHVDISHPEVLDFIDAKLVHKKLSNFNISVSVNNEFLEAVEANSKWTFKFKQKSYQTVKARDIWNKIVSNMIECAEPGLINWTNFYKNNSWYFAPICGTNPCGETVLEKYGVCDLGSLILPNFLPEGGTNTNWKKLEQVIQLAVRFLDNVIDVNKYALREIDISAHRSRRVGLGVLGVAEYLFAKKVRYGSEKAVIEVERVMKFIRDVAYKASVDLAIEKGAFPSFDPIQYGKSSFIRKLPASLRMDIKKYGVRNCTLLALAPTGCLNPSTEIITSKGIYSLNDIFKENGIDLNEYKNKKTVWVEPKKNIFVKNRDNKNRKITKLFINGISKTRKIKFSNGEILEGTLNHKLLVIKNKWKQFKDIKPGDKILLKERQKMDDFIEVVDIEDTNSFTCDIEVEGEHEYMLNSGIVSHNTISLLTQYSSGIEPLFSKAMLRKDRVGERVYVHPLYEQFVEKGEKIPEWFVDSFDLQPKDHFESQVAAQKFCDGAVSKTINLPAGTTTEQLSDLLLEYIYDLKGVTVYVDGSREGQILNKLSDKEIEDYIKNKKVDRDMNENNFKCATGSCEM